jgi:hypothetical protein
MDGGPSTYDTSMRLTIDRRRVISALFVGVALLIVLHLISQWLLFEGTETFDRDFRSADLLDLDSETSIGTWWQQLVLVVAALLGGVLGWINRGLDQGRARRWSVLGILLLLMSIDEGASVHERLIEPMRDSFDIDGGILWFAWVIPAFVTVLAVVAYFLRFWWSLPSGPRQRFAIGAALFLVGALVTEMLSGVYLTERSVDLGYGLLNGVEEGFEMVGAVLLVSALLWMVQVDLRGEQIEIEVESDAGAGSLADIDPGRGEADPH